MPIVDDVLNGLQIQIDSLWYNVLLSLAGIHWSVLRAFIMMGYTIQLLNQWLVQNAFVPLIRQTDAGLSLALNLTFVVALLVAGITYLLAAFARLRVVEPKAALAWYLAGLLFFALGPSLYQGMNDFRQNVGTAFYASTLSSLSGSTGSSFSGLRSVSSSDLGLIPLCDNLGPYLPTPTVTPIDGLDIALAYLRADGIDILGYHAASSDIRCQPHPPDPVTGLWTAGSIPWEWRRPGSFFDNTRDPVFFPAMTADERAASINLASAAQGRLLTSWALVLFGVAEQLVALLLTVAQGLAFLSFAAAVLFALFKKTEVIARSIIDLWIELIVQTVVIALTQALVVAFFLAGTASGSGIVVLGIGLICLIFMLIALWSGVRAVWNAFNRLFGAFGQATGGAIVTPGTAALTAGAAAVGGTALVAGASASALAGMTALRIGATPAQAAGLAFGEYAPLASAARTLAYLPGVRDTSLGDAADQFAEGALTRQVARHLPGVGRVAGPLVGTALLTNRDPAAAEGETAMLVPAVAQGLQRWTRPGAAAEPPPRPARAAVSAEAAASSGVSTPVRSRSGGDAETRFERAQDAAEQREAQVEAKIGETGRTGQSNEATARSGVAAQLRIEGADEIARAIADAIRLTQTDRKITDRPLTGGLDFVQAGAALTRALGVTPAEAGQAPLPSDLARFGLLLDRALRSGLDGGSIEGLIRAVKTSPEQHLPDTPRAGLVDRLQVEQGLSLRGAERVVADLETAARLLPDALTVHGVRADAKATAS